MNSPLIVIYDACVIYPVLLRDLLVNLAMDGLCRAHWTVEIQDECERSLLRKRPAMKPEKLKRAWSLMNRQVEGCLIDGFQHLIASIDLPDPNDRHVVAAGIHAKADLIVTFNLRDFPLECLVHHNLVAEHPDTFIVRLLRSHRRRVCQVLAEHRQSLRMPPMTREQYLDALCEHGLEKTVELLRAIKAKL